MNTHSPDGKSVAIIAVTKRGMELGRRLSGLFPGSQLYFPDKFVGSGRDNEHLFPLPAKKAVSEVFSGYRSLIMVMAVGAAVRLVSEELKDKHTDPAIVVVDDAGTFAVSLLSGHIGGANALAEKVASFLGAKPVITTASEVNRGLAVDLLGKEHGWTIEDDSDVTTVSAALLNGEAVAVFQDAGETDWHQQTGALLHNLTICDSLDDMAGSGFNAALIITDRVLNDENGLPGNRVLYRPGSLVVGIGCNRGTPCSKIEAAVSQVFNEHGLSLRSIRNLATIDIKKDEAGLVEFAWKYSLPVDYFPKEALKEADFPSSPSPLALEHTGTPAVCESAAILSGKAPLIVPKVRFKRAVTVAVARVKFDDMRAKGSLFLVGLGPGDPQHMTFRARQALDESDVIVGYYTYTRLVQQLLSHKEIIASGMRSEIERASTAVDLAAAGKKVAVVCSGDSGVYGMAGLIGEIIRDRQGDLSAMEVIPGVPALVACAALLGAPLTGDLASISLSDYLVPWEEIVKRLELAARSDFVIALYNPRSKSRQRHLVEARDILLRYRTGSTPVGIVTDAYRQGQKVKVTDLEHMLESDIGMTTTIIVGNSNTFAFGGRMVTSRGYTRKYSLNGETP